MGSNKFQNEILKTIEILLENKIKKLKFNYYIEGKIVEVIGDGRYKIIINGEEDIVNARNGLDLSVNDVVLILVPNGNTSFKFIDLKRP